VSRAAIRRGRPGGIMDLATLLEVRVRSPEGPSGRLGARREVRPGPRAGRVVPLRADGTPGPTGIALERSLGSD
jgi:hypothetical protein